MTATLHHYGLILVRKAGHKYMLCFDRRHPLAAYAVCERWLRDGLIDIEQFGALLGVIRGEKPEVVK